MHRLKRVETLLNTGTHETSSVPVALISFFLNLSWLGYNILLALQGYHQTTGMSIWWSLAFLATIIINSSLLIKSLDAFVFAVTVIVIMLWPISFLFLQAWIWMNGFLSAIISPIIALVITLSLIYFCLWFQASKSRIWARRTLLTVQGVLLTTSILLMFKHGDLAATPGGMTLAVAVVTLLVVPVLIAAAFWFTQKQDGQLIGKIFWAAFTIQLIAAIGAVYYYAVSPAVRHLGQPVDVREIRLGDRPLSRPFVEEGAAYLVSGDGRLYEVNLFTGREQTVARISLPEPAEIGYLEYTGGAGLTEGSIARKAQDELTLKVVYSLWRDTDQGLQDKHLTLEVTVNQVSGQVSWRPTGYIDRPGYRLPEPAEDAGITIFPPVFDALRNFLPMRISGARVETTVKPKGNVLWTYARQGWLLAGTDQGALYIITAGSRLAPDKK